MDLSCRTAQIIFLVLAVTAVGVFLFSTGEHTQNGDVQKPPKTNTAFSYATTTVTVGTTTIVADVADTSAKRSRGLSGRTELPEGHGMLFVFDEPDTHSFWMKDMRFPIDIIWINTQKEIVHITRNATPDSYPETFSPLTPAQYVLETNTDALPYISTGDIVHIK